MFPSPRIRRDRRVAIGLIGDTFLARANCPICSNSLRKLQSWRGRDVAKSRDLRRIFSL